MIIEKLTNFDYIVLSLIFISTLFAFFKGLIKSLISILGWALTSALIYFSTPYIKILVKKFVSNNYAVNISNIVISFVASVILSSIFTGKLYKITDDIRGGFLDRFVGALFGILRGSLICGFIVLLSSGLWKIFYSDNNQENKEVPDFVYKSQTYPIIKNMNKLISLYLPKSIRDEFGKVGEFKKNQQFSSDNDTNTYIEKIVNILSSSQNDFIPASDLDKLQNKDTSNTDKIKILESIYNLNKQNSNNSESNDLIKNLLIFNNMNEKENKMKGSQLDHIMNMDK